MTRTPKVTMHKHGGDDLYSWAVFVDGRMVLNGLSRSEARYYRDKELAKTHN